MTELRGPRVLLRDWSLADLAPFAALNADPEVMRHFPAPLTSAASDALAGRIVRHIRREGFGLWALEAPGLPFAGFVGLARVPFAARFTPAVEIGWRLGRAAWGRGYAAEAARLALAHGFGALGLREVVSFTVPANERSWRLMGRLGMRPDGGFEHPGLPDGHPLRPHLLYRLGAPPPA